jgi:hypothetical protein
MTANGAGVEHNNIYAHGPKKRATGDIVKRPYLYRDSAELT